MASINRSDNTSRKAPFAAPRPLFILDPFESSVRTFKHLLSSSWVCAERMQHQQPRFETDPNSALIPTQI